MKERVIYMIEIHTHNTQEITSMLWEGGRSVYDRLQQTQKQHSDYLTLESLQSH